MQLEEFLKETLIQIVNGVKEAQIATKDTGAVVNPPRGSFSLSTGERRDHPGRRAPAEIDFDIAVTASEGKETKGGVGVVAGVFALGSQGRSDATNSTVSRIKFRVPLLLPEE